MARSRAAVRMTFQSDPPPVLNLSNWILITDEDLIDAGLGTPEMIARDQARSRAIHAAWHALPIWVRAWRTLQRRWADRRWRLLCRLPDDRDL